MATDQTRDELIKTVLELVTELTTGAMPQQSSFELTNTVKDGFRVGSIKVYCDDPVKRLDMAKRLIDDAYLALDYARAKAATGGQ